MLDRRGCASLLVAVVWQAKKDLTLAVKRKAGGIYPTERNHDSAVYFMKNYADDFLDLAATLNPTLNVRRRLNM